MFLCRDSEGRPFTSKDFLSLTEDKRHGSPGVRHKNRSVILGTSRFHFTAFVGHFWFVFQFRTDGEVKVLDSQYHRRRNWFIFTLVSVSRNLPPPPKKKILHLHWKSTRNSVLVEQTGSFSLLLPDFPLRCNNYAENVLWREQKVPPSLHFCCWFMEMELNTETLQRTVIFTNWVLA